MVEVQLLEVGTVIRFGTDAMSVYVLRIVDPTENRAAVVKFVGELLQWFEPEGQWILPTIIRPGRGFKYRLVGGRHNVEWGGSITNITVVPPAAT